MRKKWIRAAALAALLALLPVFALADQFAVVTGGRLNLRQYPSANSYSLGKYGTGTWVLAGAEENGWTSVRTLDGKRGYMSAGYLDYGARSGGSVVKYANGGYVNLRSGPSLSSGVVARVTCGATVYVQQNYNSWCYVHTNVNGRTLYGYMHESFISSNVSSATVTTQNGGKVNVRSGPGSSYSSAGTLASGTRVNVLLKGNGWYKIAGNGLEGFMSTQYLSGTGSTLGTNTGSGTQLSSTVAWVNNPKSTQVLNLRETPSQSGRSIGQYRNGTKVKVVRKGSTWCEVYVGTRHGYMMTRYLSFDGNYLPPSSEPTPPLYAYIPEYKPPYPLYPENTPKPTVDSLVEYITPPPSTPSTPQSGDTITLAIAAGSSSTKIGVYNDAALTSLKAAYPHGTKAMMLKYGTNSCMIYIDGGVAYVSTWNVNY